MPAIASDAPGPEAALTAFRLDAPEDWQERLMSVASAAGGRVVRKGSGCVLWNPKRVASWRGLGYVDGVHIVRQWFGPGSSALTFLARRLYFEVGSDMPSRKPEGVLLGDARPAVMPPAERIGKCLEVARWLGKRVSGLNPNPLPLTRVRQGLHKRTRLVFGNGQQGVAGDRVSILLARCGAHSVPAGMNVELVCEDGRNPKAEGYRQLLLQAFAKCRVTARLTLTGYADVLARLADGAVPAAAYCALVAVTGRKGQPLTAAAAGLIAQLERRSVPFRLFSLDNPALRWSALDQAGSLLMGAGGVPYTLELPWPETVTPPYILGVDLGHPKARRASWVVMSLCDSHGTLIESWRHRQDLNETIGPDVLRSGLAWALGTARRHGGGDKPVFLVIRDGRVHEGEKVQDYRRVLGPRMTFVELAKSDNPEMFVPGAVPKPVQAGTECLPEGAVTPFYVPVSPRLAGDLARPLKLHMPPDWDGLNLGIDAASEILTGLSYAPGLGLAAHALPGPIYWADGIAAIGETNHQFAGQKTHKAE